MKIIFDASSLVDERMSGIGHATLELIRALERLPDCGEGFDLLLAVSFNKRQMVERWGFKKARIKTIPLHMRLMNILWKYDFLRFPDLFFGRGVYVFTNYRNWKLLFSPSITYIHDISFVLYPEFVAPKNQRFLVKNLQKWINRTSVVATDSQSAKSEILANYVVDPKKIEVLYHGVDKRMFYRRSKAEIEEVKRKYAIKGDYILFIGNIEPRKNIERLVDAYVKLPDELRHNYSLVIVGGSGWLNESIIAKISSAQRDGHNIIRPDSFVPDQDLPALYSGSALLAHPAIYEGFGLSLVQAMACGVPVLAGQNSSMIEVVGRAGLLVDVYDVDDIVSAMIRILKNNNLRKRIIQQAEPQSDKFSWDTTAQDLIKLAEKLK